VFKQYGINIIPTKTNINLLRPILRILATLWHRALSPELIQVYRQSTRRWEPIAGMTIPGCRLPLLSARPEVTFPAEERDSPSTSTKLYCLVTWWQRHIGVNNLPKVVTQLSPGQNWTHDLLIARPTPYRYATVPPIVCTRTQFHNPPIAAYHYEGGNWQIDKLSTFVGI